MTKSSKNNNSARNLPNQLGFLRRLFSGTGLAV
ncbi:hypothetical protein WFA24289_01707 [Periweissella fabaria]|uniref:Uncharacterized protein n=1 Tax=Periweissella fabaria TaxID=546157 RepID=A0ABM8Z7S3_9LACO|nr:hypothetical protein WFA24289_01707 [Periweissella fabaria]